MRVFLSSTALDLLEHRQIADDTLLRLAQQSIVMERFGALPNTPVAECERLAADADVLVCIVAHRLGFEPEPGRGSITRREVEAARRAGKPVYAWIVDDAHPWTQPKEQDRLMQPDVLADPAKVQQVAAAVQALQEFKTWLRANFVVETFTTPDDLRGKIATALAPLAAQRAAALGGSPTRVTPAPELRIIHPLQPAPHFRGREREVAQLSAWVDDIASPDRVHALVAAGGTGKTAIVERVIAQLGAHWPKPGAGSVLVWSFYERPRSDAFLRECGQLFLGESDDAPAGGRLERLQRGLRDGRPHLIVLDGLERVQAEAGGVGALARARGELEDHQLKLLLQAVAAGLGRTRMLVTSRFPLVDLRDWHHRGVVETPLDDLPTEAARAVLRGWEVRGDDAQLDAVTAQVGGHALSVAVIGSYLSHFEEGRIEAAARFKLQEAVRDDPKAAKLARVLGYYAERLPVDERDVLARLSVFPRGISLEVLGVLVDAGGAVAGVLLNSTHALPKLLRRLVDRGLVFRYSATDGTLTWTAHPFVRERFAGLLGCAASEVFEAVAQKLGQGLEQRPEKHPEDKALLDRYEQLIEVMQLAGREQEALDLYWDGLGGHAHVAGRLGEYARGHRILRAFLPSNGDALPISSRVRERDQAAGLSDLALFAEALGRLGEAAALQSEVDRRVQGLDDPKQWSIVQQNTSSLALLLGRLRWAEAASEQAKRQAHAARNQREHRDSLVLRAFARHRRGAIRDAQIDFATAASLEDNHTPYSGRGQRYARHHLDLGNTNRSRAIVKAGLALALENHWNSELPGWDALLARMTLAEGGDPQPHLTQIRSWTARTGDMEWIIEAHLLAARDALQRLRDLPGALAEADDGLRQAQLCGYRLKEIELLVTRSAIRLAWPDANAALADARRALDLATAPECGDAWGEADAAHAWGLAFVALGEHDHARRAFTQALAVRERIQHPQADATREALRRLG